jgi:dTDP-4-dehydrorhamnose reductase
MRVVVFGASGMLGSMVVDWLCRDQSIHVSATVRSAGLRQSFLECYPSAEWRMLEIDPSTASDLMEVLDGVEWAINCIGVIKPHINESSAAEVERAIRVNALFPHRLARAAEACGVQVLQIATDCVYSGTRGEYLEADKHDALDVYGKTKSLGEVASPNMHHLRVSIIGPEPLKHVSLLDWFLKQPQGSSITGYTNHQWNGITTLHFARLCHGVIREGLKSKILQHIVPSGTLTKAEMMRHFAETFHREDVEIRSAEASVAADRTLATDDEAFNRRLWKAAGYAEPPSIPQMLSELAEFDYRFARQTCARAGSEV